MGQVYILTFPDGKSYIGASSCSMSRRMSLHRSHFNKGRRCLVQKAMLEFGANNFDLKILLIANDKDYLFEMERAAIISYGTQFPNGYNATLGGKGTKGYRLTKDQIEKLSAARKGVSLGRPGNKEYRHTLEARKKISEAGKGRVFSQETRKKMSDSKKGNLYNVGRVITEAQRKSSSEKQKGKPRFSEEQKKHLSSLKKGRPWTEARRKALEISRRRNADIAFGSN